MIKKIIIILALIIPTVLLTTILLNNVDNIGTKKNIVERTFLIDGMVSVDSEIAVRRCFNPKKIQVLDVSFAKKKLTIKFDAARFDDDYLKDQLKKNGFTISKELKKQLQVVDYKIRYN